MKMNTKYYIIALIVLVVVLVIITAVYKRPVSQVSLGQTAATFPVSAVVSTASVPSVQTQASSTKTSISPTKTSSTYAKIAIPPAGVAVYYTPSSTTANLIHVRNPTTNTSIYPPLTVSGEAVGSWFFEGVFPVILSDWQGRIIARGQAKALSDWTNPGFVPFAMSLSFPRQPSNSTGELILQKDNPSGLSANDAAIMILVRFQ